MRPLGGAGMFSTTSIEPSSWISSRTSASGARVWAITVRVSSPRLSSTPAAPPATSSTSAQASAAPVFGGRALPGLVRAPSGGGEQLGLLVDDRHDPVLERGGRPDERHRDGQRVGGDPQVVDVAPADRAVGEV